MPRGHKGIIGAAAAACACLVGASTPAAAAPPSLRDLLGPRSQESRGAHMPKVARFTVDGAGGFVLDRTTPQPLLKFDDSMEVWVLQAQVAPRGDIIYKNDVGEPVLRATRLGGVTLFTPDHEDGMPVAFTGEGASLKPPSIISPNILLQRLAQASARASHAAQRLIVFDAQDVTPETSYLVADTAQVTAEAVVRAGRRPDGRSLLGRIGKVMLKEGQSAQVALVKGALTVTYAPTRGVLGRPSSEKIVKAIGK